MTAPEGTTGDPRKQPLWQAPPKPKSVVSLLLGGVGLLGIMLVIAWVIDPRLDEHILGSSPVAVQVNVVRVERATPPNDEIAFFRHLVRLPDGTEARLDSPRMFRSGSTVEAILSRGRVSGRVRLSAPYRLVAEPK